MASKDPASSSSGAQTNGGVQLRKAPPGESSQGPRRVTSFNIRMVTIPLTVLAVGTIFFLYSRTSIQAAKVNAQRHRDADGGSISWRNESARRHGVLEKPPERTIWQQLVSTKDQPKPSDKTADAASQKRNFNPIEEGIRKARDERSAGRDEK